jgi:hypothetical protein
MPMPSKHRKQIPILAKSAQDLNRLLRSAKFRAALDEFHDDPKARALASKDATRYLKRKGVEIPYGMKATLRDNNWRVSACVRALGFTGCIHYDSDSGFGWGP